jgi:hypothetical protein
MCISPKRAAMNIPELLRKLSKRKKEGREWPALEDDFRTFCCPASTEFAACTLVISNLRVDARVSGSSPALGLSQRGMNVIFRPPRGTDQHEIVHDSEQQYPSDVDAELNESLTPASRKTSAHYPSPIEQRQQAKANHRTENKLSFFPSAQIGIPQ